MARPAPDPARILTPARVRLAAGISLVAPCLTALPARAQDVPSNSVERGVGFHSRQVAIQPYLTVDIVGVEQFEGHGNGGSFVRAAGGVALAIETARIRAGGHAVYQHRFPFNRGSNGGNDVTGLLRGAYEVMPRKLTVQAGAWGGRTRWTRSGLISDPTIGRADNTRRVYTLFMGPTLQTQAQGLDLSGDYRFGFARTDNGNAPTLVPTLDFDGFTKATTHTAELGVGRKARGHPFGWSVNAQFEAENGSRLKQHYRGFVLEGEVVKPVARAWAVSAGAGWERIRDSQHAIKVDAEGRPILVGGRPVADPASGRRLSYRTTGLVWDAGWVWRPSTRTRGEVKLGHRYGGFSVVGNVSFEPRRGEALALLVYDGVQTYGRLLTNSLATVPTDVSTPANPFGGSVAGCVFGTGAGGAGTCLVTPGDSTSNGVWRARGVQLLWRRARGPWRVAGAAIYSHRRYYLPRGLISAPFIRRNDQLAYGQFELARDLRGGAAFSTQFYVTWRQRPALTGRSTWGGGIRGVYEQPLSRRIRGTLATELYGSRDAGTRSSIVGVALVGARYDF